MSSKDRLITSSYKKTKFGHHGNNDTKKGTDPLPSTSKSQFDTDMEMLRDFDLHLEFGPATGITRLERWRRADKHGLNPSMEIKDLITEHSNDERYTQSIWNAYKNVT